MSETRSVLRHSPVYLIAGLLNRGLSMLLILVYTHGLGTDAYGALGVMLIAGEIIGEICSLQLAAAVARFGFDDPDQAHRARVLRTAMLALAGIAVILLPLLALLSPWLSGLLLSDPQTEWLVLIAGIGFLANAGFTMGINHLRIERRSGAVLAWTSLRSVFLLGGSLVAVWGLHWSTAGALGAWLLANLVGGLGLSLALLAGHDVRADLALLGRMLRFAMPLCPGYLAEAGGKMAERVLLARTLSESAAGLFFFAFRGAEMLGALLIMPFCQIFNVARYEKFRDGEADTEGPALFTRFAAVLCAAALGLALLADVAVALIASDGYAEAATYLPLTVAAITVLALNLMLELGIYFQRRTARLTVITFITLAIQLPLLYWATARWGITGCAAVRLATSVVRVAVTGIAARGLGGPQPEWPRLAAIAVATLMAYALGSFADHALAAPYGLLARIAVVAIFPLLLYRSPLLSSDERTAIAAQLRRLAGRLPILRRVAA